MKVRLSFKTPDVIDYAIEDLLLDPNNDPDTNIEQINKVKTTCDKWVKYGECITVEIDTEDNTCVVLPV